MTIQQRTTLHDIAQALGLRGEKRGNMRSHPLPANTEHDPLHHLLRSVNWRTAPRAILLVTGVPEAANELSRTEGTHLDTLFARVDAQTAVAQVYVGSELSDILGVVQCLPVHLRHAWGMLADTAEVRIAVFSAGVFALQTCSEMPEQARNRIQSLTLASPFLGTDSVRSAALRCIARGLRFPSTAQCMESFAPLAEGLLAQGRPVRAFFGQADPLIASPMAAEAIRLRFPQAVVEIKPRAHAPLPEELWP